MTAERELELLNELTWSDICAGYSARELWESLVERIGERMDTEEMEMRVILDEIVERLEERETVDKRCCPVVRCLRIGGQ